MELNMTLKLPVIVLPPGLKVDGSATVKLATRELTNEQVGQLRDMRNLEAWCLISPNPIQNEDIPTEPSEVEQKTPSQRLRAVLYVWWSQSTESTRGTFNEFYNRKMEEVIEHFKSKLD